MRYTRFIFVLVFLFFARNPFFLQSSDMHFSEVEKKESNHSRSNFFHIDDQFMLFLSDRDKKEIVVHVYDSALRHKSRSILELVEKTPLIIKLINIEMKILHFRLNLWIIRTLFHSRYLGILIMV